MLEEQLGKLGAPNLKVTKVFIDFSIIEIFLFIPTIKEFGDLRNHILYHSPKFHDQTFLSLDKQLGKLKIDQIFEFSKYHI